MTLNKYDTRLKTPEELQSTLVCGEKILEDILEHLIPQKYQPLSVQSWILTGPRGSGKTHLLALLYWKIKKDDNLSRHWEPILFPEELFNVNSLHRLLMKVAGQLEKSEPSGGTAPAWTGMWNEIKTARITGNTKQRKEQNHRLAGQILELLAERSKNTGKKPILMIENLQSVFRSQLSEDELKRLRAFMQEHPEAFIIVGTALTVFDQIENYGKPFYHFFRIRHVENLGQNQIIDLLQKTALHRNEPGMPEKIRRNRPYIYTYALLTGGNARLILFLYELLIDHDEINTDLILEKITELTPYFRDKTLEASAQKQLILDALAMGAPAQTATEIAVAINEEQKSITEQLRRMDEERWVKEIPIRGKGIRKKEVFYTLRDYFYRIWYKLRTGGMEQADVACMAELAILLFDKEEIEEKKRSTDPYRSRKSILYEKALELAANESFTRNIQMIKDELKNSVGKEIKTVYKKIESCYDKQDWPELIETAKKLQDYAESEADGYYHQGNGFAFSGNLSESISFYKKAVEIKPDKHEAWYNMGASYYDLHDFEKSISCYEKAVEIKPDNLEAWYNMGKSYSDLANFEKSISCYEKAIEIKSDMHEAWYNMGNSYFYLGDFQKSISCYEKAVELKPDMHEAWCNMGNRYSNLGNFEKSISCYEKAVEIKPDMHEAWHNMGISYSSLGDFEKSISCYEKAVEIKPDYHDAWNNMGNSYLNSGNFEKSISCYEKAVEIKPDKLEAWYNMGLCYSKVKIFDKAYSCYSRFIAFTSRPRPFDYLTIIKLREHDQALFNIHSEIQKVSNQALPLSEKLEAACRLILSGKWSAIADSIDEMFKEKTWPKEEGRKLEFILQAEMLDIIKSDADKNRIQIALKYWVLSLQKQYPIINIREKCLEFVYNYITVSGKNKLKVDVVEELVNRLAAEGIEASDIIIKIMNAVKNPGTREAQKWMADPLFNEIVKMLSKTEET